MKHAVTKLFKFILATLAILALAVVTDMLAKGYKIDSLLLSRAEKPAITAYKPNDTIYCTDIMQFVKDNDLPDGDYTLKVAARSSTESYPIEVLNVYGDTTYAANTNLGNATADARMLIVKYHGDLTINQGVTVTAAARKRGMYLCVLGKLTNNGTITMTAKRSICTWSKRVFVEKCRWHL